MVFVYVSVDAGGFELDCSLAVNSQTGAKTIIGFPGGATDENAFRTLMQYGNSRAEYPSPAGTFIVRSQTVER